MKIAEITNDELKEGYTLFTCLVELPITLEDLSHSVIRLNIGRENILRELERRERLGISV